MNRDREVLLDLNGRIVYFWFYRVRDNRPLEVSPGTVSQSDRILGSEPAGKRDSPHRRRFIQSQAQGMKQCFKAGLAGKVSTWKLFKRLILKAEEPIRIPRGSTKLSHSGTGRSYELTVAGALRSRSRKSSFFGWVKGRLQVLALRSKGREPGFVGD